MFLLAALHVVFGLIWFAVLIAATLPLSRVLRRPAVVRWIDRIAGGVLIGFGFVGAFTTLEFKRVEHSPVIPGVPKGDPGLQVTGLEPWVPAR